MNNGIEDNYNNCKNNNYRFEGNNMDFLIEMDKLYYNKFNQEVDDENAVRQVKK